MSTVTRRPGRREREREKARLLSGASLCAEVKVARTIRQTKKRGVDFLMLGDG